MNFFKYNNLQDLKGEIMSAFNRLDPIYLQNICRHYQENRDSDRKQWWSYFLIISMLIIAAFFVVFSFYLTIVNYLFIRICHKK